MIFTGRALLENELTPISHSGSGSEHERLELQDAVQEPEESQHDPQAAASDSYTRNGEREPAERKLGGAGHRRGR